MKRYRCNEVFYSLQGEGVRAGTPNVFVRLSGCNLACNGQAVEGGAFQPICDTEFTSGRWRTPDELLADIRDELNGRECGSIIFTGGEPGLQLDDALVRFFSEQGWYLAVESNGTQSLPNGLDWVCVSPKTAEHTLVDQHVDELKYVRRHGQGIPKPSLKGVQHQLISPAFQPDGSVDARDMEWCIAMVKENPDWRLSVQLHKLWRVR